MKTIIVAAKSYIEETMNFEEFVEIFNRNANTMPTTHSLMEVGYITMISIWIMQIEQQKITEERFRRELGVIIDSLKNEEEQRWTT